MALIYLSPSTQEFNPYITGGNEELYMNLIADEMEPYLRASGISFVRNTRDMTAASSILASNAGQFDLHLALHSNAAPDALSGTLQGTDIYYYPTSSQGRRAAELIANGLREIYPRPQLVSVLPSTTIGEVAKVRAPSVFIEFAYHDNREDALWIQNNISAIARSVSQSVARFFGLPFLEPRPPRRGIVDVAWGSLNIRERPSTTSAILARAYDGAELTVWNQYENWYVVEFGGVSGYANSGYITLV